MLCASVFIIISTICVLPASTNDYWFLQKLDHFDYENHEVWNQRFFSSDEYYRKDGPVFLQIGGEGPASPIWLNKGHWVEIAKDVGAMLFILEHRFYGKSHPTKNTSVENLRYLSSEQALADLANFISNMTVTLGIKKWVTFGGSYPGSLSLWTKLKYPHLIQGAMSASAPLLAKMDFLEYNEVVNRSLIQNGGPECVESIATATTNIDHMLKSDSGRKKLFETFNLCEPLSPTDDEYFQNSAADSIAEIVQYNRDNREFEGATGGNVTISILCHHMTDKTLGTEVERYANIANLFGLHSNRNRVFSPRYQFAQNGQEACQDASYANFIKTMRTEIFDPSRTWTFQTCTEFGWFQSTDSMQQPFRGFPVGLFVDICQKVFGVSFDSASIAHGIQETNSNYGARKVAEVITNAVLFNGGIDPWHAMSYVTSSGPTSATFHSLFVPSSAHCAVMYPGRPEDPPELLAARNQVAKYVKQWVS